MRLIDAEQIKFDEIEEGSDVLYVSELDIKRMLTVDAVPVKHSKWLWIDGVRCSQCNYKLATT